MIILEYVNLGAKLHDVMTNTILRLK